jgi:phospholipase/carboxylesterase
MLDTELIPASEPDSRRLMIVLHGLGDSMEGYRWLPSMLRLPWLNCLLVNAPDPYYTGFAWFDFTGDRTPGIQRSGKLLHDLLDAQRDAGFPSEKTVVFGFSQGALLAMDIGTRYQHALGGIVAISGWVNQVEDCVRELSPVAAKQHFFVTHGTHDPLLPFAESREDINALKAAGLNVEWHELVKAHTLAGEEELDLIREFVARRIGPK